MEKIIERIKTTGGDWTLDILKNLAIELLKS